jgi:flagellar biosynthesis protein FlhB
MSKSEQPSAARFRRAFREGDVPFSSMVVRAAALVAVVAALPSLGHAVRSRFHERLLAALEPGRTPNAFELVTDVATLSAPIVAVSAVFAMAMGLLQTRGATALAQRRRAADRTQRLASLFDGRRAARAALGAAVLVAIAVAVLRFLRRVAADVAHALPSAQRALEVAETAFPMFVVPIAAILVTAAAFDYWLEHRFWLARLRMSRREIADERREQEGDPLVRRARRRAHEELTRPER